MSAERANKYKVPKGMPDSEKRAYMNVRVLSVVTSIAENWLE